MSLVQHGDDPRGRVPAAPFGPGAAVPVSVDRRHAAAMPMRRPRVLVFDSGLGGLTVLDAVVAALPQADLSFAADDAVFPYGRLDEAELVARVLAVMERLVAMLSPDIVVVACNTASTLVLPPLRARFADLAIVGTVPAIKPAAQLSRSRMISVLATPGTVARQYTRDLVQSFAAGCAVTLVGAPGLAALAEAAMRGEPIADSAVAAEIAPAFVVAQDVRTDVIVLACTHYPLLLDRLTALAPWPVSWVDPAPAIARRVHDVARERGLLGPADLAPKPPAPIAARFTSGRAPGAALRAFLAGRGVTFAVSDPI